MVTLLEFLFQGFFEWVYGLILEIWNYFSSSLLNVMSLDFAYLKSHIPVMGDIQQIILAVGWALLLGNLVFQALRSMASGLGFEGEDPKLLFARTFVFGFLLLANPQICETILGITSSVISLIELPDAINVQLVDGSVIGVFTASWILVIILDLITMFMVLSLLLEVAERYMVLAMLTIMAPLTFAMGGSKSTSEIFAGWCRMFGSMCFLMATNIVFFKMLLSVVSTVPSFPDVFLWMVLIISIVKVAKKADEIITRIGLNPAITGNRSTLPGIIAYTVFRTALFGYSSATDQGVVDFTASAQRLSGAYQNIERKKQSALERLVNVILPSFSDYDDYQVTDGSGGMNQNWLIAIGSVRYKQDLNVMDDNALEELIYGKLDYSASITDRVLNISIWDLTPEAYMNRLGFSSEEKKWAELLYSVMAEDQSTSITETDGTGYYWTDYGDITFSNAATPVVYYNQTDARWGNKPYGKTSTIGRAGCGPTALAIAVASLTSNKVTPYDVAQWSVLNGGLCEGSGSYHSLIPNGGRHYGLTVTSIGRDGKKLVEALQSGKLVIAIMSKGHFTSGGHFIVLRGVTEDGKILVADPASVKRSNREWDLRIVTGEASRKVGSAGGPFWVLSP